MTRPTHTDDLGKDREMIHIATFKVAELVERHDSELLQAYLHFIEAVKWRGALIEDDYMGKKISLPRPEEGLQKELKSAQAEWDRELKRYMAALKDPNDPNEGHFEYPSLRRALNTWALNEGFETIDWSFREDSEADGSAVI